MNDGVDGVVDVEVVSGVVDGDNIDGIVSVGVRNDNSVVDNVVSDAFCVGVTINPEIRSDQSTLLDVFNPILVGGGKTTPPQAQMREK